MNRIYISGPMTGIHNFNRRAFDAEAARLRALGYTVVNPAELNDNDSVTWHEALRKDLIALLECDTVALLEGWQRSNGAHLEMNVAHRVGIDIVVAREITEPRHDC
jgi:hypothetical protein